MVVCSAYVSSFFLGFNALCGRLLFFHFSFNLEKSIIYSFINQCSCWICGVYFSFASSFARLIDARINDLLFNSRSKGTQLEKYRLFESCNRSCDCWRILGKFLIESKTAIQLLNSTVYPGKRISTGGDYPFANLFTDPAMMLTPFQAPKAMNECEISCFNHFGVLFILYYPYLYYVVKKKEEVQLLEMRYLLSCS